MTEDEPTTILEAIDRARNHKILFPLPQINLPYQSEKNLQIDTENGITLRVNWKSPKLQWSVRGPIDTDISTVILAVGTVMHVGKDRFIDLTFRPLRKVTEIETPDLPTKVFGFRKFPDRLFGVVEIFGPRNFMHLGQLTGKIAANCLKKSVIESIQQGEYQPDTWETFLKNNSSLKALPLEARVAIDLGLQEAR